MFRCCISERDLKDQGVIVVVIYLLCYFQPMEFSDKQIIDICEQVLTSLSYHGQKGFIRDSIRLCCDRYVQKKQKKQSWMKLLLLLFCQKNEHVRADVYTECLKLLQVCF